MVFRRLVLYKSPVSSIPTGGLRKAIVTSLLLVNPTKSALKRLLHKLSTQFNYRLRALTGLGTFHLASPWRCGLSFAHSFSFPLPVLGGNWGRWNACDL